MAVDKDYAFDGPDRPGEPAPSLFEGRRQLISFYRFFYSPAWMAGPRVAAGAAPSSPSQYHPAHLNARDTTLAFCVRAPQEDIKRWKARMGWEIPWYTITDDFDADFGVHQWHATNAFFRDGERIFRTYAIDKRGDEAMGSTPGATSTSPRSDARRKSELARGLPADPGPLQRGGTATDEYGRADRL